LLHIGAKIELHIVIFICRLLLLSPLSTEAENYNNCSSNVQYSLLFVLKVNQQCIHKKKREEKRREVEPFFELRARAKYVMRDAFRELGKEKKKKKKKKKIQTNI
jgi:hypothetical protein